MRIFISAGEASGDALGASLLTALRAQVPQLEAFGMGGPRMRASGFDAHRNAEELNVVGLLEVLRHLPRLFRLLDDLAFVAREEQPQVAVLIDAPDFHVRLAAKLRAAGIPVVLYVGPSVWAWRPGRVERFRRVLDRLLVLFPFEVPVWSEAGVDVVHVGHPLVDEIAPPALAGAGGALARRSVALLPGSRPSELERHLATVLEAARGLVAEDLAASFVLPVAPTLDPGWLEAAVQAAGLGERVRLVVDAGGGERQRAVAQCSLALVASGTATLEVALLGVPQVIFYRVSPLTYLLARRFVRLTHFGLPNIIAGREVAPELIQGRFTAPRLVEEARRLLAPGEARDAQLAACAEIRARLGAAGAGERAAGAVLEVAQRVVVAEANEIRTA